METKFKKQRQLGAFFLILSGLIVFTWFIWLAPVKRINSESWWADHSKKAYWEESQKSIYRIGITHDVGVSMGEWGDKKWAVWIINHIKAGQDIGGCEVSHLGEALAKITNHQLEPDADIWLVWWKTNQNKSQVEWIREGFQEKGIALHEPLTTNDMVQLLEICALPTNSPVISEIPKHLRYGLTMNAFRWLRDSDVSPSDLFQIWDYDVNRIPETDKVRITTALFVYAKWWGEHISDPNRLEISPGENHAFHFYEPFFLEAKFRWKIYIAAIGLALIGIWLLRRQPPK